WRGPAWSRCSRAATADLLVPSVDTVTSLPTTKRGFSSNVFLHQVMCFLDASFDGSKRTITKLRDSFETLTFDVTEHPCHPIARSCAIKSRINFTHQLGFERTCCWICKPVIPRRF